MNWENYIVILFSFAGLFFIGAAYALYWAHKNNQLENLDEGSRIIFDDDEPEGEQTDFFPSKRGQHAKRHSSR